MNGSAQRWTTATMHTGETVTPAGLHCAVNRVRSFHLISVGILVVILAPAGPEYQRMFYQILTRENNGVHIILEV